MLCSKNSGQAKRRQQGGKKKPAPAVHMTPGLTPDPESQQGERRQSDGRSLYKDPCLVGIAIDTCKKSYFFD